MSKLCNSTENKFEDCTFARWYQKNSLAVKVKITCFVPIACLLGSIKKKGSAVTGEIACFVLESKTKEEKPRQAKKKNVCTFQLTLPVRLLTSSDSEKFCPFCFFITNKLSESKVLFTVF